MQSRRVLALCVLAAFAVCTALSSCSDDEPAEAEPGDVISGVDEDPATTSTTAAASTTTTSTTADPPVTAAAVPSTTAAPAPPPTPVPTTPPTEPPVPYVATVSVIDDGIAARMTHSWRPGCPVPLEDLRLLTIRHWNSFGVAVDGEMVVHADAADAVVGAFRRIFQAGFPIVRMELVDVFLGDDQASMRANNTSAFNCRTVAGTDTWSQHSYGRAVDVNPLLNPWVRGNTVDPPEGAPYADRAQKVAGGIYAGDAVVKAFQSVGWTWGGSWSGTKDYQHFSANGR